MAPRFLTPNSDGDILGADGTIVRISPYGTRYRMRDLLRWAKARGFTSARTYRSESPKRAWTLTGHGVYEGFTIMCWNRSNRAQVADFIQQRDHGVFYKGAPLMSFFDPKGATLESHQQRVVDLLLEDTMPFLLRHATYSNRRAFAPSTPGFRPILLSQGIEPTLDVAA